MKNQNITFVTKRLMLFLCIVLMCIITGCNHQVDNQQTNFSDMPNDLNNYSGALTLDKKTIIDNRYLDSIQTKMSNAEYVQTTVDYANQYKELIDKYYNALLEADNIDAENIVHTHTIWERYSEESLVAQKTYLEDIYGSGTIVPKFLVDYQYRLYRTRAIELFLMCRQNNMNVDGP